MPDELQPKTAVRALRVLGDAFAVVAKYALTAFLVLISIWLIGRIMEALYGNTVFDPVLTHWLGIAGWILLVIWIIGWGIGSAKAFLKAEKRWHAVAPWAFFLILFIAVLIDMEGFQVSSSGLFATVSGSVESSQQASFLLFKFHPANPMLAVNLVASKLRAAANFKSMASYVWSWNTLFAFFIWSFAWGIFLLRHKDNVWQKTMHLIFAICGLGILIVLKAIFPPKTGYMAFMHAAAATLLVFQVLLTYSTLRSFAEPRKEIPEEPADPFSVRPKEEEKPDKRRYSLGLPPTALKIIFLLFIILPILADLHQQSKIASSSATMMSEMVDHEESFSDMMTVAPISVHAGPAIGDEVVGVLPKSTRVPVVTKKYEWVNIGENKWVAEKWLRPVDPYQSGNVVTMKAK